MEAHVLLHEIKAPQPIDATFCLANLQRRFYQMEYFTLLLDHIHDFDASNHAFIMHLPARDRIEGALV